MIRECPICGERYIIREGTEDKGFCKKHIKCERCGKIEDRTIEHKDSKYCSECRKVIKSEAAKKFHEIRRETIKTNNRKATNKPEFTIDDLCKIRNALNLPNHMEIIMREIERRGIKIVRGKVVETWPEGKKNKSQ